MKKISKIFVAIGLSVALMLSSGREAKAQFVVTDPPSLVQAILDFVSNTLMTWTESAETIEKYKELIELAKTVGKYADMAMVGYDVIETLTATGTLMADRLQMMAEFQNYFQANGFANYYLNARYILNAYNSIGTNLLKNAKDSFIKYKDLFSKDKSIDVMQVLSTIRKTVEDFAVNFEMISGHYLYSMSALYRDSQILQQQIANGQFTKAVIHVI